MSKNIVEAYKEFNKQLIILISGLSGSGKTSLSENISRDFKLKLIDTKQFYKKDFDEKITLSNGVEVVNYDSDDAFDWEQMNKEVNKYKEEGIVVIGHLFPTNKLQFNADYHVHLKITKQELRKNRMEFIEKHPEKKFNIETESLRINALTYPYYLETLKKMKMDKYLDVSEMDDDVVYDIVFDDIIKFIKSAVYSSKYTPTKNTKQNKKSKKSFDISDTLTNSSESSESSESSDISNNSDDDYIITYNEYD